MCDWREGVNNNGVFSRFIDNIVRVQVMSLEEDNGGIGMGGHQIDGNDR